MAFPFNLGACVNMSKRQPKKSAPKSAPKSESVKVEAPNGWRVEEYKGASGETCYRHVRQDA